MTDTTTPQESSSQPVSPPPAAAVAAKASNARSTTNSKRRVSSANSSGSGWMQSKNSGESDLVAGKTAKRARRKSTHTVRKEETALLRKELEALKSHALMLRQHTEGELKEKALLNVMMQETHRTQQLTFAVAQSAVSGCLKLDHTNPLSTHIRLGKDWDQRRNTLLDMKEKKIQHALEYAHARSQFLNPLQPHHSEERFENANGDYCCARFDLTQFEGVQSLKQVFDTLLSYNLNVEISVSERLGHITVREDYDNIDQSISNYRLLSTQCGVDIESHVVTFAHFFESHELSNGKPCGIFTFDSVDQDELYPYSPTERVRKDVAQVVVLTPHTKRNSNGEEELVVVMAIGKFLKLHSAEFAIPGHAVQGLRNTICWEPVMVTTINELLHPEFYSTVIPGNQNDHSLCATNV